MQCRQAERWATDNMQNMCFICIPCGGTTQKLPLNGRNRAICRLFEVLNVNQGQGRYKTLSSCPCCVQSGIIPAQSFFSSSGYLHRSNRIFSRTRTLRKILAGAAGRECARTLIGSCAGTHVSIPHWCREPDVWHTCRQRWIGTPPDLASPCYKDRVKFDGYRRGSCWCLEGSEFGI